MNIRLPLSGHMAGTVETNTSSTFGIWPCRNWRVQRADENLTLLPRKSVATGLDTSCQKQPSKLECHLIQLASLVDFAVRFCCPILVAFHQLANSMAHGDKRIVK